MDYSSSLPPWLLRHVIGPHLESGGQAVVLAEDWQTAEAVIRLDRLLRRAGLRERVVLVWNANNTFGFDGIDWSSLRRAALLSTVSRYMKRLMAERGLAAVVVPNGILEDAFEAPEESAAAGFRHRLRGRTVVAKVARFDPAKRWLQAVEIISELKRRGLRPLLIARGGTESHGVEVMQAARARGLAVVECHAAESGASGFVKGLVQSGRADILQLRSHLDPESRRLLLHGAAVVLANSAHEPFGLVGLETMAAGGLACTGCSGEEYAVPGRNALVLKTADPLEFVGLYSRLSEDPEQEGRLRRAARRTARAYLWAEILRTALLPRLTLLQGQAAAA